MYINEKRCFLSKRGGGGGGGGPPFRGCGDGGDWGGGVGGRFYFRNFTVE